MEFWKAVEQSISLAIEDEFSLQSYEEVSGGDINRSFRVHGKPLDYFVKTNDACMLDMFEAEANALKILAATQTIRVPRFICSGIAHQRSYFVLEHIQFGEGNIAHFAKDLAALHACSNPLFGFVENNYIGLTPQNNDWTANWIEFFAQSRLLAQLDLLGKKGASAKLLRSGKTLSNELAKFFDGYEVKPALLHGDLWQGNYAFDQNGRPVIYDPASYYGDHEAELAMLELFGNPGAMFYQTYHRYYLIDKGYPQRKSLYNLYHILNHANLFGGHYLNQAQNQITQLLS